MTWQPGPPPQPGPFPQQPYPPYPPPGPRRRHRAPGRTGSKLKWLLSGAAVMVAVIVGAVFALTSGGHSSLSGSAGGAPAGTGTGAVKPAAQWQALSAEHHALGTWSYGNSLVVAANTEITAYSQVTGAVRWRTRAPVVQGIATMFCGASASASGSTAVVGLGAVTDSTGVDSDCHSIASLSLATGQLGWVTSIPSNAEQLTYARSLEGQPGLAQHGLLVDVSGPTVVAGWVGVLAGFSLATGAREWTNVVGGDADLENYIVKDIAISGASTYAAVSEVFPSSMQLLRLDTAAGTVTRKVAVTKSMTGLADPLVATIVSTAPLTAAFEQVSPTDATSIVFFTPSLGAGHVLHGEPRVPGGPELFTGVTLGNDEARQFSPFAVGDGLLAVATVSASDGAGNTLVAYSSATGARKWAATVPGTEFFYPVAVTGSVVQAVGISDSGRANPVLVSVDAATGEVLSTSKPRVLGPAPLGQANAFYRYVTAGGHVYGVDWGLTRAASGSVPAVFSLS